MPSAAAPAALLGLVGIQTSSPLCLAPIAEAPLSPAIQRSVILADGVGIHGFVRTPARQNGIDDTLAGPNLAGLHWLPRDNFAPTV